MSNEQGYDIPGLPEGWEAVAVRNVRNGESYLCSGQIERHISVDGLGTMLNYLVVRPKQPPAPTYRPFANAAEFRDHRCKWWKWKDKLDNHVFCTSQYSDTHHEGRTWQKQFETIVFEDGSPFGIRVAAPVTRPAQAESIV